MVQSAVALLQGDPAFECLKIVENRLRLDRDPPPFALDHGVPGAEVSVDREGDFRAPSKTRMQASAKPADQPQLTYVAERVAAWVGANHEVEPDDRAPCAHVGN